MSHQKELTLSLLLVEFGPMGVIKLNHGQILKKYFFHDF